MRSGASQFEAIRAAQGAFAQERGETLGLLKDILPFLGDSEQAGGIRANVLESMFREMGMGVNPMMQQILNSLRNPETDPAVAAAIQQYQQANALQAKANTLLGRLDARLADEIAKKNETSFRNALDNVTFNFENAQLDDIAKNVNTIVNIMQNDQNDQNNQQNLARGGVVYAQAGQQIFQPKGTDTVPAMLTPGEFVVNRKATQANLPLLKSINSGYYANGGLVTSWNGYRSTSDRTKESEEQFPSFKSLRKLNQNFEKYYDAGDLYFSDAQDQQFPISWNDALNMDLTRLKNNGGKNYIGYAPVIQLIPTTEDEERLKAGLPPYSLEYADISFMDRTFKDSTSRPINSNFPTLFDGLEYQNINKDNEDTYKKAINDSNLIRFGVLDFSRYINEDLQALPSQQNRANILDPSNSIGASKSFGIFKGIRTESIPDDAQTFKIWDDEARYELAVDGITSTNNPPGFSGDNYFADHTYKKRTKPWQGKILTNELTSGTELSKLFDTHNLSLSDLKKAETEFNAGTVKYRDVKTSGLNKSLFEKLSLLYNNQSAAEEFTGDSLKALINRNAFIPAGYDGDPTIKNLIVAGRGATEAALLEKAREAIQLRANNQVPVGIFGAKGLANSASTIGMPFDIATDIGVNTKDFAWAANISYAELGKAFEEAKKEEQRKRGVEEGPNKKTLLGMEKIKTALPAKLSDGSETNIPFEFGVQYEEYIGKLFDTAADAYSDTDVKAFLPFKVDDPFHLFKNVINDGAKRIGLEQKLSDNELQLPGATRSPITGITKDLLGQYYDSISGANQDGDANLKNQILNGAVNLGPLLLRLISASGPMPVFTQKLAGETQSVNIGEALVENIKKQAMSIGDKARAIDDPLETKGEQLEDSQLAAITRRLAGGSIEIFRGQGFARRFGRLWGPLLANVSRNRNIDEPEEAKAVAGVISNAFNQLGGLAGNAFNMARAPRIAQIIKDAFILSSGAWQTFGGINQGDTGLLRDFVNAGGEDLPTGYIEGLFRSLGGGAALNQIKNYKLPAAYSDMFKDRLKGGKIAQIGADGSITYTSMADSVPEDVGGLINLIFNPYNEFANVKARTELINRFQDDLNNLKGGGGLPFFDPKTLNFVNSGVDILEQWYGGNGGAWLGQDALSDAAFGTPQQRANALIGAFQNAETQNLYKSAQEVNAAFGLKNKFGPLPGAEWFRARAIRGDIDLEEPQNRARGGIIYAQSGGRMVNFQPKGTDTVPAMLTPGEFVINRKANQENLPLLKAINHGETGYSRGGVVYAEDGGRVGPPTFKGQSGYFTSNDGKKIFGKLVSVSDKEAVINYAGRDWTVPLTRFDDATRNAIASGSGGGGRGAQTFLDQMTTEGALGLSGRPTGGMLKVPTFARDMATGTFTDNTGRHKTYGEIVEVGSDGIMLKNRTGVGFVPYNRLDAKSRSLAYELYTSAQRTQTRDFDSRINRLYPGGLYPHMRIGLKPEMTDREIRAKVDENERNRTTRTRDPDQIVIPTEVPGISDDGYPINIGTTTVSRGVEEVREVSERAAQSAADRAERIAADRRYLEKARARGADSRTGAERRERDTSAAQERAQKRFNTIKERRGEEAAREAMVRDGYTQVDGQWTRTPRERGEGAADFEQNMANRYWQQYNASGTDLDPVTWAERNLPGLPNNPKTYEAYKALAEEEAQRQEQERQRKQDKAKAIREERRQREIQRQEESEERKRIIDETAGSGQEGITRAGDILSILDNSGIVSTPRSDTDIATDQASDAATNFLLNRERRTNFAKMVPTVQDPQMVEDRKGADINMPNRRPEGVQLRSNGLNFDAMLSSIQQARGAVNQYLESIKNDPRFRDVTQLDSIVEESLGIIRQKVPFSVNTHIDPEFLYGPDMQAGTADDHPFPDRVIASAEQGYYNTLNQRLRSAALEKVDRLFGEARGVRVYNKGGVVYANQGMLVPYEPRGTDTVPAMPTPGEFVVNREATQQNLPLLRAINRSRGGSVSYLAEGTDKETEYEKRMRLRREAYEKEMKRRREAMATSREQGVSYQQAYYQQQQQQQQAAGGIQQISQPQQGAPGSMGGSPATIVDAFNPINNIIRVFTQTLMTSNQGLTQFAAILQQLSQTTSAAGGTDQAAAGNGVNISGIEQFTQQFGQFVEQLAAINLPPIIRVEGQVTANVNFAGAEALRSLADTTIRQVVEDTVNAEFNKRNRDNEGQD